MADNTLECGDRAGSVTIATEGAILRAELAVPAGARGSGLCVGGGSRFSPRDRYVAEVLHRFRLATLLLDLLTGAEEASDRPQAFAV